MFDYFIYNNNSKSLQGVKMEEKLLEKEYDIPYEIFGEAYKEFQKKYVLPRSYI